MRLAKDFYKRDVLQVAPDLLGKVIVRRYADGRLERFIITETEAYRGEDDKACHARKGRTARTEIMYQSGGLVYVYFIYGMYWLLNIVCAEKEMPQAALIRSVKTLNGPGRVGRSLELDKSFYGEELCTSQRLWLEEGTYCNNALTTTPRVGIDYAPDEWRLKPWRYLLEQS